MTKISKEELARIVGHDEDAEHLKKEVTIIFDNKQYSIRIPKKFAELAKINPNNDTFEFTLVPIGEKGDSKFTIEADLKREDDE
ncbi:hypothetical protein HQ545_08230 [Candidatus Woesearchaeota archaeon]|nr:hypothetical protein [Candidatus Woesearchaeota archaeon]